MRTLIPIFGLLPSLVLASGCDPVLFSAELDAPDVCIDGYRLSFPPLGMEASSENTMSTDDLGLPDTDGIDLNVSVLSVGFAPTAGVEDLGFVHALSLRATSADQASSLPDVMVVDMDAADVTTDGGLYSEPETPVDIASQLTRGDVAFRLAVAGDLPDLAWQTRMELCVHAMARYRQPI